MKDYFEFRRELLEAALVKLNQKVRLKEYPYEDWPKGKATGFNYTEWRIYKRDGMELKSAKVMETWNSAKTIAKDKFEFTTPPTNYEVRVHEDFYGAKLYMKSLNGGKSPQAFFIDMKKSMSFSGEGKTTRLNGSHFKGRAYKEWAWAFIDDKNPNSGLAREVKLFHPSRYLGEYITSNMWDSTVVKGVKLGYGMLLPNYVHPTPSNSKHKFSGEPPVVKNAAFEKAFKSLKQYDESEYDGFIRDFHDAEMEKEDIQTLWDRNSRDVMRPQYGFEVPLSSLDKYMKKPKKYRESGNIDWKKMKRQDASLYNDVKQELINLDSSGSISPQELLTDLGSGKFSYIKGFKNVSFGSYKGTKTVFIDIDADYFFTIEVGQRTDWQQLVDFIERKIYEGKLEIERM